MADPGISVSAPMGPIRRPALRAASSTRRRKGSNVGRRRRQPLRRPGRGFRRGAARPPSAPFARVLGLQGERLWQALGDLYPSDAKIGALRAARGALPGALDAMVVLGQSGSDAVTRRAEDVLARDRAGPACWPSAAATHGLCYGPLAACSLRASYLEPFSVAAEPARALRRLPGQRRSSSTRASPRLAACSRRRLGGRASWSSRSSGAAAWSCRPVEFMRELGRLAREAGLCSWPTRSGPGSGARGASCSSPTGGGRPGASICLGKGPRRRPARSAQLVGRCGRDEAPGAASTRSCTPRRSRARRSPPLPRSRRSTCSRERELPERAGRARRPLPRCARGSRVEGCLRRSSCAAPA